MRGLSLVFCLAVLLAAGAAARKLRQSDDFDFFYLVRQWPGSFCTSHACPLLRDRSQVRFTIHGLWPNRRDGTWPQFCDKELPFDADELEDLRTELDEDWPSFYDSTSSDNFWAHEWNKHGTCTQGKLHNEHEFFKAVLDLNHRYNLEQALQAAGADFTSPAEYSKEDVQGALRDAFGVNLLLHCSRDQQLTEVWMCFDKSLNPIDCDESASEHQHCPTLVINPFPSDQAGHSSKLQPQAGAGEGEQGATEFGLQLHYAARAMVKEAAAEAAKPSTATSSSSSASMPLLEDGITTYPDTVPQSRPGPPRGSLARSISIGAAGGMLVVILMVTVFSSWARRSADALDHYTMTTPACHYRATAAGYRRGYPAAAGGSEIQPATEQTGASGVQEIAEEEEAEDSALGSCCTDAEAALRQPLLRP